MIMYKFVAQNIDMTKKVISQNDVFISKHSLGMQSLGELKLSPVFRVQLYVQRWKKVVIFLPQVVCLSLCPLVLLGHTTEHKGWAVAQNEIITWHVQCFCSPHANVLRGAQRVFMPIKQRGTTVLSQPWFPCPSVSCSNE